MDEAQGELFALKVTADAAYKAYDRKRYEYLRLQHALRNALAASDFLGSGYTIAAPKGEPVCE